MVVMVIDYCMCLFSYLRDMGLVIQGIEPGGRIYQDGRLKVQDRIVEINGTSLVDVDFTK